MVVFIGRNHFLLLFARDEREGVSLEKTAKIGCGSMFHGILKQKDAGENNRAI